MRRTFLILASAIAVRAVAQSDAPVPPIRTFQPGTAERAPLRLPTDTPDVAARPGDVDLIQDARITALMDDFAKRKHALKGYRVQIHLGDRQAAEEIRRSFLVKHPDTPAYLSYLAPNFRVRVGDVRTRLEAEKLKQSFKDTYPGAYIVTDEIEMPRLPE